MENEVEFNRPADRLINIIQEQQKEQGKDPNAHNTYEIACKILRQRLGVDIFETKSKSKRGAS